MYRLISRESEYLINLSEVLYIEITPESLSDENSLYILTIHYKNESSLSVFGGKVDMQEELNNIERASK